MIDYEQVTPHRSKKNTKKWCKGKVGVIHQIGEWEPMWDFGNPVWFHKRCTVCRKALDWEHIAKLPNLISLWSDREIHPAREVLH